MTRPSFLASAAGLGKSVMGELGSEFGAVAQDRGRMLEPGETLDRPKSRGGLARFMRDGRLDAHAQIVPGRLACDRIAVGAAGSFAIGQPVANQMIEQESAPRLRRARCQIPCSGALADGVPGP